MHIDALLSRVYEAFTLIVLKYFRVGQFQRRRLRANPNVCVKTHPTRRRTDAPSVRISCVIAKLLPIVALNLRRRTTWIR